MGELSRRFFIQATAAAATLRGLVDRTKAADEGGVYVNERPSTVVLGNEHLEITFQKDTGGVKQIHSLNHDIDLRDAKADVEAFTWRLQFYRAGGWTAAHKASSPSIRTESKSDSVRVSLTWSNPKIAQLPDSTFDGDVSVDVTLRSGERFARWNLSVTNRSDFAIRRAACPVISSVKPPVADGSDAIIYPTDMGRRVEDPTSAEKLPENIYPGALTNMQFTAYSGDESVFYLQAEDATVHQKSISWQHESSATDRLRLQQAYLPPKKPGGDVSVDYSVAIGWLNGNWYDAAEHYRTWVDQNGWLPDQPPELPDWLQNLGANHRMINNRWNVPSMDLTNDEVPQLVRQWQDALGVQNYHVFWWGGRPAENERVTPIKEPESFRSALDKLTQQEISVGSQHSVKFVLNVGTFWRNNEQDILDWSLRKQNGDPWTRGPFPPKRTGLDQQATIYQVDFTVDGWQEHLRELFTEYVSLGVKEIFLDGFPVYWPGCYSDHHDHPPGRGKWFPQQSRQHLKRLKTSMRQERSDAIISGEGIADFYLPYYDIHWLKDVKAESYYRPGEFTHRTGDIIPLFRYTFGDYVSPRALQVDPINPGADNANYKRLVIARALTWGAVPSVFAPDIRPEEFTENNSMYIGRVGRARETYANRFLSRGTLLREQNYDTEEVTFSDTIMTREGRREYEFTEPAIKGSAWRSSRGEVGLIFTCVAPDDESYQATINLTNQPFELPSDPWFAYTVTNGAYAVVAPPNESPSNITLDLSQEDVVLFGITPATGQRMAALEKIVEAQSTVQDDTAEAADLLSQAKRAFETDDTSKAVTKAEAAINAAGGASATVEPTQSNQSDESTTSTDSPGFTSITGLVGLLGGFLSRWLSDSNGKIDPKKRNEE